MKILYIHGFNGTPDGPKLEMLRTEYPAALITAPQHDSNPHHVHDLLDKIAATLNGLEDLIIGNSLSGFWANLFSLRYGVPALLINPAINPSRTLASLDYPLAETYQVYEQKVRTDSISPRTVLLAENDEVIPYQEAFEFFSGICQVKLLKSGGHRMNDPESIAIIKESIPTLLASVLSWGLDNDD